MTPNRFKFRAWDKVNKCWLEQKNSQGKYFNNHYIDFDGWVWNRKHINSENSDENDSFSKNEVELMQSTSLLDREGVEIFEGDVIKNTQADWNTVIWFEGEWCFENYHAGAIPLSKYAESSTIIGNKFENN